MIVVEFSFDAVLSVGSLFVVSVEHVFQRVGSGRGVGHVGWLGADAVLARVPDDSDERLAADGGLAARGGRGADGDALGRHTAGLGTRRASARRRARVAFASFHAVVLFDLSEHRTGDVAGSPAAT